MNVRIITLSHCSFKRQSAEILKWRRHLTFFFHGDLVSSSLLPLPICYLPIVFFLMLSDWRKIKTLTTFGYGVRSWPLWVSSLCNAVFLSLLLPLNWVYPTSNVHYTIGLPFRLLYLQCTWPHASTIFLPHATKTQRTHGLGFQWGISTIRVWGFVMLHQYIGR